MDRRGFVQSAVAGIGTMLLRPFRRIAPKAWWEYRPSRGRKGPIPCWYFYDDRYKALGDFVQQMLGEEPTDHSLLKAVLWEDKPYMCWRAYSTMPPEERDRRLEEAGSLGLFKLAEEGIGRVGV